MRGLWYYDCASDKQVQEIVAGGQPPGLGALLDALEKRVEFDKDLFKGIKGYLNNLHDLTHGGSIQIRARNTLDEVTSNYKPEHIAGLVEASAALSLNAAVAIAGAIGDEELAKRMFKEYQKIEHKHPDKQGYVVGRRPP